MMQNEEMAVEENEGSNIEFDKKPFCNSSL